MNRPIKPDFKLPLAHAARAGGESTPAGSAPDTEKDVFADMHGAAAVPAPSTQREVALARDQLWKPRRGSSRRPRSAPPDLRLDPEEVEPIKQEPLRDIIRGYFDRGLPAVVASLPAPNGHQDCYDAVTFNQYIQAHEQAYPDQPWRNPKNRVVQDLRAYLVTPGEPHGYEVHYLCTGLSANHRSGLLYQACLGAASGDAVSQLILGMLCRQCEIAFPYPTGIEGLHNTGDALVNRFVERTYAAQCVDIAANAICRVLQHAYPNVDCALQIMKLQFPYWHLMPTSAVRLAAHRGLRRATKEAQQVHDDSARSVHAETIAKWHELLQLIRSRGEAVFERPT